MRRLRTPTLPRFPRTFMDPQSGLYRSLRFRYSVACSGAGFGHASELSGRWRGTPLINGTAVSRNCAMRVRSHLRSLTASTISAAIGNSASGRDDSTDYRFRPKRMLIATAVRYEDTDLPDLRHTRIHPFVVGSGGLHSQRPDEEVAAVFMPFDNDVGRVKRFARQCDVVAHRLAQSRWQPQRKLDFDGSRRHRAVLNRGCLRGCGICHRRQHAGNDANPFHRFLFSVIETDPRFLGG